VRSAAVALALSLAALAGGDVAATRAVTETVYVLSVRADGERAREWVAPQSGAWRAETSEGLRLFAGDTYARLDPQTGWYVRTGSPAFLGHLADGSATRRALLSYLAGTAAQNGIEVATSPDGKVELRFRVRTVGFVATIDDQIDVPSARELDLFRAPTQGITTRAVERPVGAVPLLPLRAYWLGRRALGRRAVTVVEHESTLRARELVYIVFYELPSARGRSSALPGQQRPAGEIQVSSQPRAGELARRAIRAFNGRNGDLRTRPWPRTRTRLRTGERVTVIPDRAEGAGRVRAAFYILTRTTLVSVTGAFRTKRIVAAARGLRPVTG
jgi:hypothetical protein